jgi:hypothetical protein
LAFAVLSGFLSGPATARASCGEYILHPSQGHAAATLPSAPLPAGQVPAPVPAPCWGASCSEKSIPLTPPPSTNPVEEERWAFPLVPPQILDHFGLPFLSYLPSGRAIHFSSAVYHPPR